MGLSVSVIKIFSCHISVFSRHMFKTYVNKYHYYNNAMCLWTFLFQRMKPPSILDSQSNDTYFARGDDMHCMIPS